MSLFSPKLLTVFRNSRWRPPPLWYLCYVPNLVQISVVVTEIDTHTLQTFIWWRHANWLPVSSFGHVVICTSPWCIFPYNLMLDIFIQSKVIDIFPKFKTAAAAIYLYPIRSYSYFFPKLKLAAGFAWVSHVTTHEASFVVRTSCKNFIMIG